MKQTVLIVAIAITVGAGVAWLQARSRHRAAGDAPSVTVSLPSATGEEHAARSSPVGGPRPGGPAPVGGPSSGALVSDDPADPAYSPTRLLLVGKPPLDVFNAEPITQPWSSRMTTHVRGRLEGDLRTFIPDAVVNKVECRTSSCCYEVELASKQEYDDLGFHLYNPPLGDTQTLVGLEPGENGHMRVSVCSFISDQHRDESAYRRWYDEHRAQAFARYRADGLEVPEL